MSNAVNETGSGGNSCAETVPRKNKPNQIKRDIRALERWLAEAGPSWPRDLRDKGQRALLGMKMLEGQQVPEVGIRETAKDLADFTAAYAAFVASKGA